MQMKIAWVFNEWDQYYMKGWLYPHTVFDHGTMFNPKSIAKCNLRLRDY